MPTHHAGIPWQPSNFLLIAMTVSACALLLLASLHDFGWYRCENYLPVIYLGAITSMVISVVLWAIKCSPQKEKTLKTESEREEHLVARETKPTEIQPREMVRNVWSQKKFPIKAASAIATPSSNSVNFPSSRSKQVNKTPPPSSLPSSPSTQEKMEEGLLWKVCQAYQPFSRGKFYEVIRLFELAIQQKDAAALLYQNEHQTPLEILLEKLKESAEAKDKDQEKFMHLLEQEVLLRACINKIKKSKDRDGTFLQEMETHLVVIEEKAQRYLSAESEFMPQDAYTALDYGITPLTKEEMNNLLLMDQEIKTGRTEGTQRYAGVKLSLDYLRNFLLSEITCQHIHNMIYPLAENIRFFITEILRDVHEELQKYATSLGENDALTQRCALEIAEKVLAKVDLNGWEPNKSEVYQLIEVNITEHAIAMGIRKLEKGSYEVALLNGGSGLQCHPADCRGNPLLLFEGSREEITPLLARFFILQVVSLYKERKVEPEEFYELLFSSQLKRKDPSLTPRVRKQELGNCGIHNFRELIYYNIQRLEAAFAQKKGLKRSREFPASVANQLQNYIYRTGKLNIQNNPYLPEGSKQAHKKRPPLPGI